MELVVIESPFMGKGETESAQLRNTEKNLRYLRAIMADCFDRGEYPYASHGLYTQPGVLRDHLPEERRLGMEAGFAWGAIPKKRVIYHDLGTSSGMVEGLNQAKKYNQVVEDRVLGDKWCQIENKLFVPIYLSAELEARLEEQTKARGVVENFSPGRGSLAERPCGRGGETSY